MSGRKYKNVQLMAWRFQVQTVVRNAMILTEKEYVVKETAERFGGELIKVGANLLYFNGRNRKGDRKRTPNGAKSPNNALIAIISYFTEQTQRPSVWGRTRLRVDRFRIVSFPRSLYHVLRVKTSL